MDACTESLVTLPPESGAPTSRLARLADEVRARRRSGEVGTRQAAEDRLWEAARPRLVRMALALGVPASEVPDLVQDALLAAHRALGRFDPEAGSFEAWIGTILLRRTRNLLRARRRRRVFLDALRAIGLPVAPRPSRGLDGVEARLVVERLLGCLTDVQREVVALYEIGELDAAATARVLGITPAGVRSIARDARRRLAAEALRPMAASGVPAGGGEKRS